MEPSGLNLPARVLVTGAGGFVGSYVVRALIRAQVEVCAVVRPSTDLWRLDDLPEVQIVHADLRDIAVAAPAIRAFAPEAGVHLAWSSLGHDHRNAFDQTHNVSATCELVQRLADAGCRAFVGVGTQAEYGPHRGPIDESYPTRPVSLYGASKLAAALLSDRLCALLGLRFAWLRLFSPYGPRDNPKFLIPYVIRTLLAGETPRLSAGTQKWDYLYVEDAARAVLSVLATHGATGVFNLGSGQVQTIRAIAEQIRDGVDPDLPLEFGTQPPRDDQSQRLQADIGRLRAATGWTPTIHLHEGLERTIRWYRSRAAAPTPKRLAVGG